MAYYAYCRVSTKRQRLDRQITNITTVYPSIAVIKEYYTGTTTNRPQWERLKSRLVSGDTVVFDSVSRMSRNADEGFTDYRDLYNNDINLVFLKEPHINTEIYKQSVTKSIDIKVSTGNDAVDEYFSGNMDLVNRLLMRLAEQQIKVAFEQSEKEVEDLHRRISEGIRESVRQGTKIGLAKGTSLTTKKAIACMDIIKKHSASFGGTLSDVNTIKLCGCSRNSYYKYKRLLLEQ